MRLIKITGGLGNQLFIYAFYVDMKRRYPNTRLDISDMVHYNVHNGYEMNRVFSLPKDEFCIYQPLKKVMEFTLFKTIIERKQKGESLDPFTKKYLNPNVYYKGFYQSERFFKESEEEVRRLFSFDMRMASNKSREMAQRIDNDPNAVSIHIRRGDYLQPEHWKNTGSVCQLPYYLNAIEEIRGKIENPNFYIFSDDLEWVRENLGLTNSTFVDWNRGEDSWQDMMLMSRCRHHVICNSTFSWWGAWLNPRKDKIVVVPERWFQHIETPYIYPEGWIKVSIK